MLVNAFLILLTFRLVILLLAFRIVLRLMSKIGKTYSSYVLVDRIQIDRILWAVKTAGRYLPKVSCLIQAMAAYVMLEQQGYFTHFKIGVAKNRSGGLEAHAWVECDAKVVIGSIESSLEFIPLPGILRTFMEVNHEQKAKREAEGDDQKDLHST